MQNFNMHTHTFRCGHAVSDEIDYSLAALEGGITRLGFSEHIAHEGFDNPTDRINFGEMGEYYDAINALKEKMAGKMEIFLGAEMEYFDDNDDYYDELKSNLDYMIVGQHNDRKNGIDYTYEWNPKAMEDYARLICTAVEKGYTRYIAHPSYPMLSSKEFTTHHEKAIEKIANAAKKYGAALEWNLKGMSKGIRDYGDYKSYIYPHKKAWEIIREINPKIVIGYDAHNPKVLINKELEKEARRLLDGVEIVERPEMFLYKNF